MQSKYVYMTGAAVAALSMVVLALQPYYVEQCSRDDPEVNTCLMHSANRLARLLQRGIPELGMEEVEPVVVDEINIQLGGGPDGYRATFRDIEAYGVSNLTLTNIRSDIDSLQFQMTFEIPHIRVRAKYQSSGVLILVKASGAGDYWGEYDGIRAKIYFKAIPVDQQDGLTYLRVEEAKMDFSVKNIQMGVDNVAGGNVVIQAALNLFINSNAQELLKEMKPALRNKLTTVMHSFIDKLFERIPLEHFLV